MEPVTLLQFPFSHYNEKAPSAQDFLARFEAHPAIAWTLQQCRRHRPRR